MVKFILDIFVTDFILACPCSYFFVTFSFGYESCAHPHDFCNTTMGFFFFNLVLVTGSENSWLVLPEDFISESTEPVFLELHATAMLCLPSGECMCPDATVCTTLMSCLYSSVSEEVVLNRQLMVCFFDILLTLSPAFSKLQPENKKYYSYVV